MEELQLQKAELQTEKNTLEEQKRKVNLDLARTKAQVQALEKS